MDDPAIRREDHIGALGGLARINRISSASAPVARAIRKVGSSLGRAVRVVDVATGGADVLLDAARRSGFATEIVATDISETALEVAQRRAAGLETRIVTKKIDVLREDLPESDLVVCTLFLHHLDTDDAVVVLKRMRASGPTGVVSDLRRGAWGTALAASVPRVLTRSRVVHVDALRSARAAWSVSEMRALTDRAGLDSATIRPAYPARMIVEWGEETSDAR